MDDAKKKEHESRFLNDVRDHQMEIIADNGVNRHLRFKRPDTGIYYFDILTWQGKLCISLPPAL